jgi:hypothetical protein
MPGLLADLRQPISRGFLHTATSDGAPGFFSVSRGAGKPAGMPAQYHQGGDVELRGGRGRPARQGFADPERQLDKDTTAAISAVSQGSTGTVRIRMHNKPWREKGARANKT